MIWIVNLNRCASRALKAAPNQDQARLRSALLEISDDPYRGDIKRLRGHQTKTYRYQVGSWRIPYTIYDDRIEVNVAEILGRSSTTYA